MPPLVKKPRGLRVAIIYWRMIHSVGGIATHLNTLRQAALDCGDKCDILMSDSQKSKTPQVFPERKWVRGGDTNIWIDGEAPHHPSNVSHTLRWLKENYDAICFGKISQHKTTAYPEPYFLPLYDLDLPKVALITDGYWDMYSHWAEPLLSRVNGVLCNLESYAIPLRKIGCKNLVISAIPFRPMPIVRGKAKSPLLIWPSQWKDIKGIKPFLEIVPQIKADVELYSCGIRYYQLRTEDCWKSAVAEDKFKGFNGDGKATYFGNVDLPQASEAMQRAWLTVNLQGMRTRKETYRKGSYNYTEVEAMYYGACPILHSSTSQTELPEDCYLPVDSAQEIPARVSEAITGGFAIDSGRRSRAREYVLNKHLAADRYLDMRRLLT